MTINRGTVFQAFKYAVYLLLTINVYVFFAEENLAAALQFPDGVRLADLIEAYASTIDTAAWVVLLLMFELETSVLEDRHYTRRVSWTLHGVRILCYAFIVYAFWGYIANAIFAYDVAAAPGIADLCSVAADGWSYAVDLDEYVAIAAGNCADFSASHAFWRFGELPALVDAAGLRDIQYLAWVDVVNGGVWLLIVMILELDVLLQERKLTGGLTFTITNAAKVVCYAVLFLAAIYWGVKGDVFPDFWDAFLWLVAFFFIELNIIDWRQEIISKS